MMDSGHGFPSRNRGKLSSANTPKTGVPKPTVPKIFVPDAASFLASSLLIQSLLGRCTSSGTPASTAATMARELTAWTWTITPAFFASSSTALRTSNSFSPGPGTGVRAISPVNLIPMAAIFRISARAVSGVLLLSRSDPEGMMRGPLMRPFSM